VKLSDVGNRVRALFGASAPPTIAGAQRAREDRASVVLALRKDVRGLQQEITDLSEAGENGGAADEHAADSARLALLQHRLEQKQAELAKYQARV
jgi:hypothetical protein